MIFVESTTDQWMEKHPGLEKLELECSSCGNAMVANKPFVEKGYAGLVADQCSCGKNKHICVSKVTTSRESYIHWMSLLENYL